MSEKRLVALKDVQEHKERAKGPSGNAVRRSRIVIIGRSVVSEPIEKKISEKHFDQALENAIVRGDFEKVKKLVKQDGAKPMDRHLETATDMKEEKIAKYLKAEMEKRRNKDRVSRPSEDGWD